MSAVHTLDCWVAPCVGSIYKALKLKDPNRLITHKCRHIARYHISNLPQHMKYGSVCRGYGASAYQEFRDCSLSRAAKQLASAGRVAAVSVLLARHPYVCAPHALEVLSSLPETFEPLLSAPLILQVIICHLDSHLACSSGNLRQRSSTCI